MVHMDAPLLLPASTPLVHITAHAKKKDTVTVVACVLVCCICLSSLSLSSDADSNDADTALSFAQPMVILASSALSSFTIDKNVLILLY